jgi:DinB superfamily
MDAVWRAILWRQFGAAIDMLEEALRGCPDELWGARLWGGERPDLSAFWYVGYHTLFWLDLYLSGSVEGFVPPAPFTLDELDPAGLLPERQYTRGELLSYLDACRGKGRASIEALTDESVRRLCKVAWGEVAYLELLLDNMRHVQEHAAQLNLFLGQQLGSEARWVSQSYHLALSHRV